MLILNSNLELILPRKLKERGGSGRRVARRKARVKRGVLGAEVKSKRFRPVRGFSAFGS